jgi:chitodextrinase
VYEIDVRARDAAGNFSAWSPSVIVQTEPNTTPDNPPSAPTSLQGTSTANSVSLTWTASTDDKGVAGYDVYRDGAKVSTVTGTSATVSGLSASTAYKFKVQAKDTIGQASPFSTEITVTTKASEPQPGVKYGYTLSGVSQLKTLTTGPVPLNGGIDAELELATGAFTGDLTLNSTKANLKVLGLVPVKADIGFEQVDKTRGTLKSGVLQATAKFNIRMKQLYLFGVLPVAGDGQCRTKSATIAKLQSTGGFFDPLQGGRLIGSYGISDLTGCGLLEAFISPLAKGGGNTIDINLKPKV